MTTNVEIVKALEVLTPTAQWNLIGADYANIQWFSPEITKPTQEQINAQIYINNQQAPLDACKKQASDLLYETDWTTIPDITDPTKSNPYLGNQQDYIVYRNALRQLAVYPVANPVWPTKPITVWRNA